VNGRAIGWRLWGGAILAGCAVVAAALAMPVRVPEAGPGADPAGAMPEGAVAAAPEDLSAFLEIRRWGEPPAPKPEPELSEPAGTALNPELARMGFVGLIATQDTRAVLLALPEGDIVRMLPGDTLPDGRILVSVTDNDLTLEGENGAAEVLTLFPPLPVVEPPPAKLPGAPAPSGESGDREALTLVPPVSASEAPPGEPGAEAAMAVGGPDASPSGIEDPTPFAGTAAISALQ